MESPTKSGDTLRKYGRDYLLQLRMHPFSLQKPHNLPNVDVIKDRLYFHQIDNISSQPVTDQPTSYYTDRYHCMMKPDTYKYSHQQRSLPAGYVQRGPFYNCNQKYNSSAPISKYRSSTYSPPYYNAPQKQSYRATTAPYKADISAEDFFDNMPELQTAPWYKDSFPVYASENSWNLNQKVYETKSCSSQQDVIHPKSKKKLSIIDPKTGKDILDGIETSTNSQSSVESKENADEETAKENAKIEDSQKMVFLHEDMNNFSESPACAVPEEQISYLPATSKQSGDSAVLSLNQDDSDEEFLKEYRPNKNELCIKGNAEGGDIDKNAYRNFNFTEAFARQENSYTSSNMEFSVEGNPEYADVPDPFENKGQNSKNPRFPQTTSKGFNEAKYSTTGQPENNEMNLREKVLILRDKMYCMKQEQQKMAIMQSFLRFKKHQLDETFRNLDEKKVDIVNWEYNLYTKAKKLHEKEHWLEAKSKALLSKEKQLEEKEKWLESRIKEMENKYGELLSKRKELEHGDVHKNNTTEKLTHREKFVTEGDKSSKSEGVHGDKNKIFEHERNSSMERKDYYSGDVYKDKNVFSRDEKAKFLDQKSKTVSAPISQRKTSITSEGRKYFPEHIRYQLNHKDKKRDTFSKESHDMYYEGKKYFSEHVKSSLNQKDKRERDFNHDEYNDATAEVEKKANNYQRDQDKIKVAQNINSKAPSYSKDDSSRNSKESEKASILHERKIPAESSLKRRNSLPSEGRKYFPEHLKFYLNRREKEMQETTLQSKDEHDDSFERETSRKKEHEKKNIEPQKASHFKNKRISFDDTSIKEIKKLTSEGRKHFPEHLKFYLNQKEINVREKAFERDVKSSVLDNNLQKYKENEPKLTTSEGEKSLPEKLKFHKNPKEKNDRACSLEKDGKIDKSNSGPQENVESGNNPITSVSSRYVQLSDQFKDYWNQNEKKSKESTLERNLKKVHLNEDCQESVKIKRKPLTSEGRKYLPEHLKGYLNRKEKDTLENILQQDDYLVSCINADIETETGDPKIFANIDDGAKSIFKKPKLYLSSGRNLREKESISSEGRKYFPEHIKWHLNQKDKADNKYFTDVALEGDSLKNLKEKESIPSEGRKYFPEHIKWHLNQKDKSANKCLTDVALEGDSLKNTKTLNEIQEQQKLQDIKKDATNMAIKPNLYKLSSDSSDAQAALPNNQSERSSEIPSNAKETHKRTPIASEGRKYFPEHVKYYLNYKEKAQESSARKESNVYEVQKEQKVTSMDIKEDASDKPSVYGSGDICQKFN